MVLRAGHEGGDVLDLLVGELVAEGGHRAAAVRHLLDDQIEIEQGGTVVLEQQLGTTFKLDATMKF